MRKTILNVTTITAGLLLSVSALAGNVSGYVANQSLDKNYTIKLVGDTKGTPTELQAGEFKSFSLDVNDQDGLVIEYDVVYSSDTSVHGKCRFVINTSMAGPLINASSAGAVFCEAKGSILEIMPW